MQKKQYEGKSTIKLDESFQPRTLAEAISLLQQRRPTEVVSRFHLKLEEVNALARLFTAPYSQYGQMQAYITEHGQLPPEKFRRK